MSTTPRVQLFGLTAVLALLQPCATTHAQDIPVEVREPALPLDREYQPGRETARFLAGQAPARTKILLIPTASVSDDRAGYGPTLGIIVPDFLRQMPLQARAGYRRLNPDEAASLDRWILDGKLTLFDGPLWGRATSAAANGEYARTVDTSDKVTASAGVERSLDANSQFFVAVNGVFLWSEPEGGASQTAFTAAPGVFWVPAAGTRVALDYRFDNDVDGEDTFAFTISQLVPGPGATSTRLGFGVGKHGVVSISAAFIVVPGSAR